MKSAKIKIIGFSLLVFSGMSYAGLTMTLTDSEDLSNGKTLCLYENSQRSEQLTVDAGRDCPFTHTFE